MIRLSFVCSWFVFLGVSLCSGTYEASMFIPACNGTTHPPAACPYQTFSAHRWREYLYQWLGNPNMILTAALLVDGQRWQVECDSYRTVATSRGVYWLLGREGTTSVVETRRDLFYL